MSSGKTHHVYRKRHEAASRHDAILLYNNARSRLLDINRWHLLFEEGDTTFALVPSSNGRESSAPSSGDYIRAEKEGEEKKTEWFRIGAILENKNLLRDEENFGFILQAVNDPSADDTQTIVRPGTPDVRFEVTRSANVVTALQTLIQHPHSHLQQMVQKVRRWVANIVAFSGISGTPWKNLINGLLEGPAHRWDKKVI